MRKEHFEYFKGRICTIFTVPTNRNFKEENPQAFLATHFHYFMGQILDVDDEGVVIQQVARKAGQEVLISYFFKQHIIAIVEEEIVQDEKTIKMLKEANEKRVEEMNKTEEERTISPYIDPDKMKKRAEDLANRFKK